jgi:hypothetical protein
VSRASHLHKPTLVATGLLFAIASLLLAVHPAVAAAKSVTVASNTFRMSGPDDKQRLTVGCPGRTWPLGGAMMAYPPPSLDGEGVYPHSYERLGVQQGFHVTAVLFDPSRGSTQPRDVTLQVVCGQRRGHVTPPHQTKYVRPGQTETVVATCPGRRHLFSGGFQRTDFTSQGGNFVTESRAISSKSWSVTAHAHGNFGGEITAIAYCLRSKKPLLTEVSSSTMLDLGKLGLGKLGTATTPACPPGRRMTTGGFSHNGSTSAFFGDGSFNADGTWSASGFNRGLATGLTAYGYCLKV